MPVMMSVSVNTCISMYAILLVLCKVVPHVYVKNKVR